MTDPLAEMVHEESVEILSEVGFLRVGAGRAGPPRSRRFPG